MGHAILTPYSIAVITGATAFFYYLSGAHRGPEQRKWEVTRLTKERYGDLPGYADNFHPTSLLKLQEKK